MFVDGLRNNPTSTVAAPFSLRPKRSASVAVPVTWDEIDPVEPDTWTLTELEPQAPRMDDIVERARVGGVDLDTPFDRFGRR